MKTMQPETPGSPAPESAPASAPRRFRTAIALIVLAALIAAVLVTRLALVDEEGPTRTAVTVRGWAYADAPLQNATLSIHTSDGDEVVRSRANATNANGTFAVPTELPPDYRVTVAGGTIGEQVFTGRLVADVAGYGPSSGLIEVNPVTTLLAAYQDRHRKPLGGRGRGCRRALPEAACGL